MASDTPYIAVRWSSINNYTLPLLFYLYSTIQFCKFWYTFCYYSYNKNIIIFLLLTYNNATSTMYIFETKC